MARRYKRLKYQDRLKLKELCNSGIKAHEMATILDVAPATIYRELTRGGVASYGEYSSYDPEKAQKTIFS